MKNIHIALLTLFILTSGAVDAQAKKYKIEGIKCTRVEIIVPGDLFSTYDLNDGEIEMLKIQKVNTVLMEKIVNNHKEDAWPSSFGNLDQRIANPEIVKSYVVYKLADLEDKVVLIVPAKYNKDKDGGWSLSKDIFLIMNKSGIK